MTLRKALALAIGITITGSGAAFAGSAPLSDTEMDRVSAQGIQTIVNQSILLVNDQNNNLDSVQLNDFAQESSTVEGLVNSAVSAVNASANLLYGDETTSSAVTQENTNTAQNHVNDSFAVDNDAYAQNINKQTQYVNNDFAFIGFQDNNNNSVQLNDDAQRNSEGVSIINSAFSADNFGLNIYSSGSEPIRGGTVTQTNTQNAYNMNNTAEADNLGTAYAQNYEEGQVTQQIINGFGSFIVSQNNNDNSVQVNDQAQQNAVVDSLVNTAKSATNTGANLATVGDLTGTDVYQTNTARAENHVNDAFSFDGDAFAENLNKQTQNIDNGVFAEVLNQENNNNSVQLNDNAQQNASAVLIENSATSAVNAGLNVLNAGNILNSDDTIEQTNNQTAENFNNYADGGTDAEARNWEQAANPGQYIANRDGSEISDQNNNNNSVQLNDYAQQNVTADKVVNSANSAVNVGQNLLNWETTGGDITNSIVHQENTQVAKNHYNDAFAVIGEADAKNKYKQTQVVNNFFSTDLVGTQNNNMNSVQLNDNAQQFASAVVLVNSAGSAVNTGLNVINVGSISSTCLTQTNTNTAVNFSNTANGGTFAYAINRN